MLISDSPQAIARQAQRIRTNIYEHYIQCLRIFQVIPLFHVNRWPKYIVPQLDKKINVMCRTGHRLLKSLRVYERSTDEQHKAVSTLLSSSKEATFQEQHLLAVNIVYHVYKQAAQLS